MQVAVQAQLMTADELLRLPDDGMRHELIRGELRTMSPTGFQHARVTQRSTVSLGQYVEAHQLGEVVTGEPGFRLTTDPDTVRAPDVAFVSAERLVEGRNV